MAEHKILVVDGDLASRNYIATALQNEGHSVLQAASGKEGLIAAWRDRPDLIIADPILADLPGEEMARRLRSDARTARLPLVALSSDSQPARQKSCLDAGFNDYVVKAAQAVPQLLETVARHLGGKPAMAKEGGLLIVFLSAKGGTGTSSLCANLSMNIAVSVPEARVAVADLVLPIGSIAGIIGAANDHNLVTIAGLPAAQTTAEYLRTNLPHMESWSFHVLAGSPDPEHANKLEVGRIGEIVSGLKSAYDFVVLDLGRSLSRISLPLIEQADLVVIVTGVDVSTMALTKTLWEYLQTKGIQPDSAFVIMNRAVGLEGLDQT